MMENNPRGRKCAICEQNTAQYKCTKCPSVVYCSLDCYKKHSETHSVILETSSYAQNTSIEEMIDSCPSKETEDLAVHSSTQAKHAGGNKPSSSSSANVDTDGLLTRKQLHALSVDEKIVNQLKSRELQELTKSVDGSRSRLDALETAEYNVPEFATFVEHVAQVLFRNRE